MRCQVNWLPLQNRFLDSMKKIFALLNLFIVLSVQAQNADVRISALMGKSRWFDLAQELHVTPADSVNPLLHKMALAMTYHYFNQSDSACIVLGDLLNNHQEELGANTLNMAVLLGMNLARTDHYAEAAGLIQNLCDQLKALGTDSTQIEILLTLVQQYHALANNAPICQPLHQADTYRIPMKTYNTMHTVDDKTNEGHFITMDGRINGLESSLVFDTGAGVNTVMGMHSSTGIRPKFLDKITAKGIEINPQIFDRGYRHTYLSKNGNKSQMPTTPAAVETNKTREEIANKEMVLNVDLLKRLKR